jgi:hypothetical protein
LTSDGLKEFKKIGGQTLYEEYISGIVGGKK